MEEKTRLLILFGGQSSEHEISCLSAQNVIHAVDADRYEMLLVGITRQGHWIEVEDVSRIEDDTWRNGSTSAVLSPDATMKGVWLFREGGTIFWPVDVAFPVLHGLYGEDGTVQGLLELAHIPYVGCGVLSSALAMDKVYTKKIVDGIGIRQADYIAFYREELKNMEQTVKCVESVLDYPMFVKPSRAGSSRGVSRVTDSDQLRRCMTEAGRHDRIIMVEEAIAGREIECAVLGGVDAKAAGVGEILPAGEFYDYDSKYNNSESKTLMDPDIPAQTVEEIRRDALNIFQAIDGWGMARVDFFVEAGTGEVVFNEINTIPGFTAISMYAKLWEAQGISINQLVESLIQYAFHRE